VHVHLLLCPTGNRVGFGVFALDVNPLVVKSHGINVTDNRLRQRLIQTMMIDKGARRLKVFEPEVRRL
jgi:hypothetical protein